MLNKGFTLIELLVVVLIIGILVGIALPFYTLAVEKSRAAEAMITVRALRDAEKLYRLTNGAYTDDFSKLDYGFFSKFGVEVSGSTMSSKHFTYALHNMTGSVPHAQALRTAPSNWYIVSYLDWTQQISCVAQRSNKDGNELCSRLSSTVAECPESGFNCYQIPD